MVQAPGSASEDGFDLIDAGGPGMLAGLACRAAGRAGFSARVRSIAASHSSTVRAMVTNWG